MQRIDTHRDDDLIDLGAVIVETKGGSNLFNDTNGPQQAPAGLTDD